MPDVHRRRRPITELIDQSSLGSRRARAVRELTDRSLVSRAYLEVLRVRANSGDRVAEERLSQLTELPVTDEELLAFVDYETAAGAYEPPTVVPPTPQESRAAEKVLAGFSEQPADIVEGASGRQPPKDSARMLDTDLWTAIDDGGIEVCYQPKVEMASGIIRGAEALVRWYHPQLGSVRPSKLVQVAERTGAIGPLTRWVLYQALTQCQAWRDAGWDLGIAVNLSARNLADQRLAADVARLLDDAGVPPASLTVEITETMVVSESQRSQEVVQSLADMGVKICCDDFGTGYASLARLRWLPISEIKVDRSFVARMAEDDTDRAITRSVIALGRGLGLTVVAEGVESRTVWDLLRGLGCDQAQGFLICRPLPAEKFSLWVDRQTSL